MTNKRGYFRLEYPPSERPRLRLEGGEFAILDLSEKGIKFDCGPRFRPTEGSRFKGTVVFREGVSCNIAGTIIRFLADKHEAVLSLAKGIPLVRIMEEQRYLLKKYKALN